MKLKSLPLLLVLAAAVTACQKEVPAPTAAPAPAPVDVGSAGAGPTGAGDQVTDEVVWDESDAPVAGTRISISPDPVPFCDASQQVVEVEWDVAAAEPAHLQIWIEGTRGKRKLWTATKTLAGSKITESWAKEGMKFVALDAKGKRVINSATVTAATCP